MPQQWESKRPFQKRNVTVSCLASVHVHFQSCWTVLPLYSKQHRPSSRKKIFSTQRLLQINTLITTCCYGGNRGICTCCRQPTQAWRRFWTSPEKKSSVKPLRNREKIFGLGENKPRWTEKPKSKPNWKDTWTPTWKKRVRQAKQRSVLPHHQHFLCLLTPSILQHQMQKSLRDCPLPQPFWILQAVIGNFQSNRGNVHEKQSTH